MPQYLHSQAAPQAGQQQVQPLQCSLLVCSQHQLQTGASNSDKNTTGCRAIWSANARVEPHPLFSCCSKPCQQVCPTCYVCVPQFGPQFICCVIQHMLLHIRAACCCLCLVPAGAKTNRIFKPASHASEWAHLTVPKTRPTRPTTSP